MSECENLFYKSKMKTFGILALIAFILMNLMRFLTENWADLSNPIFDDAGKPIDEAIRQMVYVGGIIPVSIMIFIYGLYCLANFSKKLDYLKLNKDGFEISKWGIVNKVRWDDCEKFVLRSNRHSTFVLCHFKNKLPIRGLLFTRKRKKISLQALYSINSAELYDLTTSYHFNSKLLKQLGSSAAFLEIKQFSKKA